MHPCLCGRSQIFVFFPLHACLRAARAKETLHCQVEAHVFHSVLSYHAGPHLIEHTFTVLTCTHFGLMCALALLVICIHILLISVS